MPQIGTNGDDPEAYFNNTDAVIYGLDGDDFIRWAQSYGAYIDGGRGNDTLIGGDGADRIYGGDGNDLIRGGRGQDLIYGGEGNDVIYVESRPGGRFVEGTRPEAPSTAYGGGGDDTIHGLGSNALFGDDGNDTIYAGSGGVVDGGRGDDIIFARGNSVLASSTRVFGGDGNDLIYGMEAEVLYGGNGSDSYEITSKRTRIFETGSLLGEGPDKVFAYVDFTLPEHVEYLLMTYGQQTYGYGNSEANIIIGNVSDNVIEGRGGYDTLVGGGGSDLFVVNPGFGVDVITDFVAGAGTPDAVIFSSLIFSTYAQVMGNSRQVGSDVWIENGGNTVVLSNVSLGALHADDFGFV